MWKSDRMMRHPFHAHVVKFRVADPRCPEETGWKDVAVVTVSRDLLVSIEADTEEDVQFMFLCYILEHNDAGMTEPFLTGSPPGGITEIGQDRSL
nr:MULTISPECIES: multicopper oxidase domain-containing protein [unclassified Roseovarius]